MAADAVYHQLAYEMTGPGVAREAVLPVMTRMQTVQLRPLMPLLLLFLVGAVVLGAQRARGLVGAAWIARLLMAPALTIPLGVLGVRALGIPRRLVALVNLGIICGGLVESRSSSTQPPRCLTISRAPRQDPRSLFVEHAEDAHPGRDLRHGLLDLD